MGVATVQIGLSAEEFCSKLEMGRRFLVRYMRGGQQHERVALWPAGIGAWSILTPDGDVYVERYLGRQKDASVTGVVDPPSEHVLRRRDVYHFSLSPTGAWR